MNLGKQTHLHQKYANHVVNYRCFALIQVYRHVVRANTSSVAQKNLAGLSVETCVPPLLIMQSLGETLIFKLKASEPTIWCAFLNPRIQATVAVWRTKTDYLHFKLDSWCSYPRMLPQDGACMDVLAEILSLA